MTHTVAVYGTLKRNKSNHDVLGDSRYLGTDNIRNFDMYDLGAFPAIIESEYPTALVVAEFFEVSDEILESVDILEGYNAESPEKSLYLRKTITHPKFGECFIYVFRDQDLLLLCPLIHIWV